MRKDKPTHDIIVSYADYGYGHIGLVYQATHWIYTGMSAAFKDYVMDGDDRDHLTQQDEWKHLYGSVKKAREVLGDKIVTMERSRKHRYVCFNGHCRARNRELRSKLNYEILPYPKNVTDEVVHIVNASTIKPLEEYQ